MLLSLDDPFMKQETSMNAAPNLTLCATIGIQIPHPLPPFEDQSSLLWTISQLVVRILIKFGMRGFRASPYPNSKTSALRIIR
jgi:hypothetical protein